MRHMYVRQQFDALYASFIIG
eukprot:COSAG03_NODE_23671_length_278_cov_0.575419_1_plen_20_part_10